MIALLGLKMLGVADAAIRTYPLDERCVYTLRLSVDEPTTCVFPGTITGLVGAKVADTPKEEASVLLSHASGAEYFSLRALKPDATAALNVLFRGKVYVLSLVTGTPSDRAVAFAERPNRPRDVPTLSEEELRSFLERAKTRARFVAQYPAIDPGILWQASARVTAYRDFTATVEEVSRFEAEDVVVLRVRLESTSERPVQYYPTALAVRVGRDLFPARLTEASGLIPAKGAATAFLLIHGSPGGGRADLGLNEAYSVIVPTVP
ncbi:MAG: hypothetical protein JWM32_1275 [Verrucomicrobia bacterium]|nr:hypothetical protein [Verrucomicrobiota bacterium]